MPLFQYQDRDGTTQTFSGPLAHSRGAEAVFLDALGCSYVEALRLLATHSFSYDGQECLLGLTITIKQIDAVQGQAELNQLAGVMRQITQKYGFKECPECSAIHSKAVRRCRKCGHEADVPDEVKKKMTAYYLDEDEPEQAQEAVQELAPSQEQSPDSTTEEAKPLSPLHMMALDKDEEENGAEKKATVSPQETEKEKDAI